MDKTTPRPVLPRAKLEQAIILAKSERKAEATQMLREIVALQPVNQVAWLWLSAVAATQAEAESALAQARKINPVHPSLPQAEKWLQYRFPQTTLFQKQPPEGSVQDYKTDRGAQGISPYPIPDKRARAGGPGRVPLGLSKSPKVVEVQPQA